MKSENFVYWLQGLFELSDLKTLNAKQVDIIRRHLAMVFVHEIDPSMGNKEHQVKLDQVHKGIKLSDLEGQIQGSQQWSTAGTCLSPPNPYVVSQSNPSGVGFDVRTVKFNC